MRRTSTTDYPKETTNKRFELTTKNNNFSHIVNFAAGIRNDSNTTNDSYFVDCKRISLSCISSLIENMSDHDTLFLTINTITEANQIPLKQRIREVINDTIAQFQLLLQNKTWKSVKASFKL